MHMRREGGGRGRGGGGGRGEGGGGGRGEGGGVRMGWHDDEEASETPACPASARAGNEVEDEGHPPPPRKGRRIKEW
eukprot:4904875-Pyramimonas_sp.AAC.1